MLFREGKRIRLKAFGDCPEEYGHICGEPDNGTIIVQLDDEYCEGSDDDGLREVPVDQIEEAEEE